MCRACFSKKCMNRKREGVIWGKILVNGTAGTNVCSCIILNNGSVREETCKLGRVRYSPVQMESVMLQRSHHFAHFQSWQLVGLISPVIFDLLPAMPDCRSQNVTDTGHANDASARATLLIMLKARLRQMRKVKRTANSTSCSCINIFM